VWPRPSVLKGETEATGAASFFAFGFGGLIYDYAYGSCWAQVPTRYGWQWAYICRGIKRAGATPDRRKGRRVFTIAGRESVAPRTR